MDTKKLRQKILDLAISGKLVPQDPNDEPASVLLERIRAEKERLIAEGKIKRPKKSKSSSAESHYQQLPDGWAVTRLADIAWFGGGKTPSTENRIFWNNGTINWITSKDMKEPVIIDSKIKLSAIGASQSTIYPKGTLLMVTRSGILRRTLPLAITGKESTVNQDIKTVTTPFYGITEYLYWYFTANESEILEKYQKDGTTVESIDFEKFQNIEVLLPPLAEQERIIKQLKLLLQLIDVISADSNRIKTTIEKTKSKILDLAMQGKLVPQDPADEPAVDMLRRINPKAKIITDNPHYPQLPDNWVLVPLEDITEYEQPQPYIVQDTSYSDRYTIPVLTAGKSFILGYTNEDFGVYENVPAIIFDDFTTDSRLVNFPFKVKSSAMKIIQVKHGLNIDYVALFMSMTRLMGETHKRYWISEYSKILIPIPPLKEQDRIVERVNVLYHELYKIISVLSA